MFHLKWVETEVSPAGWTDTSSKPLALPAEHRMLDFGSYELELIERSQELYQ